MRDFVVLAMTLVYVPLAFARPLAGYLLWGWAGLIGLNLYLFGFMVSAPFVQIFALATLLSLLVNRDPLAQRLQITRTSALMILFAVHGFFSALTAYPGIVRNWELCGAVAKTVLFCLLMPTLVVNRLRIHAMVVMIALATTFHGVLDGLKFLVSGGAFHAIVNPKFGDNNHGALVLTMVLPFLFYLYHYSARALVRWGSLGGLLVTVLAVVSTHSRGGFVGMGALAAWTVLQSRRKVTGLALVALAGVLVLYTAPESWTVRMGTIENAEDDASFMGRVAAWKASSAIALEHPFFGGGFRAVQTPAVWEKYKYAPGLLGFVDTPVLNKRGVAAHSIWFEVLGDQGFVGLTIFVALIVNAFLTRRTIWRLVRARGEEQRWAGDLADTLAAALVAYVVSGSLLSAAYFELPYVCMMLLEVVKRQQTSLQVRTLAPGSGVGNHQPVRSDSSERASARNPRCDQTCPGEGGAPAEPRRCAFGSAGASPLPSELFARGAHCGGTRNSAERP
ncbi:putative O-glycosylation ligase, exosortase A system-associated [Candidatus Binatia bacterium]|nr:putative O-glycosylation ligase, exosortase A system-associated [Candidatus Binatia bacterium]